MAQHTSDGAYHYAKGAAHRVGTDRDELVEDLVKHGYDRDEAEAGVEKLLEEL